MGTKEAATYLGYSAAHLRVLARGGAVACSNPGGGKLIFRKEDLDEFLERHRKGGETGVHEAICKVRHK
jgi:excisionase family DNA binding protein